MPAHDFKDIGDVLNFQLLKGIITAIDSATDTCTVAVGGDTLAALLYYHCEPSSELRDNGAISGAAKGFSEGDEVIVLINKEKTSIKVIGHTDGIRRCEEEGVPTIPGRGRNFFAGGISGSSLEDSDAIFMILESDDTLSQISAVLSNPGNGKGGIRWDAAYFTGGSSDILEYPLDVLLNIGTTPTISTSSGSLSRQRVNLACLIDGSNGGYFAGGYGGLPQQNDIEFYGFCLAANIYSPLPLLLWGKDRLAFQHQKKDILLAVVSRTTTLAGTKRLIGLSLYFSQTIL